PASTGGRPWFAPAGGGGPVGGLGGDRGAGGVGLVTVDPAPPHPGQPERDLGDRGRRRGAEAPAGLGPGDPVPDLDAVSPARLQGALEAPLPLAHVTAAAGRAPHPPPPAPGGGHHPGGTADAPDPP